MSVLIFANGLSGVSGLDKSLINTANELCRRNYDVHIITLFGNDGGLAFANPRFNLLHGVGVYALKAMCVNQGKQLLDKQYTTFTVSQPFLSGTFSKHDFLVLSALNRILDENDTVFFTHPVQSQLFQEAIGKEKRRVKTVLQIHGNYKEDSFLSGQLFNSRKAIDYLQIVAPSMHGELQEISRKPGSAIRYIPNIHRPLAKLEHVPSEYFRVSLIGSIQPRKNQLDALRIAELFPKDSKIVINLWGGGENGEYGKQLKTLIAQCGLDARIRLLGIGTEEEIYSQTDLVLSTSKHEGFGYFFLEAASYGIPAVSYDFAYGASDFIEEGDNGFLIPMGDAQMAAKRILACEKDSGLLQLLGENAQEKFYKKYSIDYIISLYEEIIGSAKTDTINMSEFYRDGEDPILYDTLLYERGKYESLKEKLFKGLSGISQEKEENVPQDSVDGQRISFQLKEGYVINKVICCAQNGKRIPIPFVYESQKIAFIAPLWKEVKSPYTIALEMEDGSLSCLAQGSMRVQTPRDEYSRGDMSEKEQFSIFPIDDKKTKWEAGSSWRVYDRFESIRSIEDEACQCLPVKTKIISQNNKFSSYFFYEGEIDSLFVTYNSGKKTRLDFPKRSYTQIFELIQEIEDRYCLYGYMVADIFVWPIIKAEVIDALCRVFGLWGPHFRDGIPLKNNYRGSKNLRALPDCERLIFEHPRKGHIIDLRTRPLHKGNYITLEYPQSFGYTVASYTDGPVYPMGQFLGYLKKYKLSKNDSYNSHFFRKIFQRHFGIEIDFHTIIDSRLRKFKAEYVFWSEIFSLSKIQEIVLLESYWFAGIVSAAHDRGIKTASMQYAMISPKHPTRLTQGKSPYHADKIYCWSPYWQELAEIHKEYAIIPRLFADKEEVEFFDFCVISQPRVEKRLLAFLESLAKSFPQKKIAYAAHPAQSKARLRKDPRMAALPNVFVPDQATINVIRNSEIVLGVFSTSLFEAAYFGKSVYVIPIPGYDIVSFGIKQGLFRLFTSFDDLQSFTQPAIAQSLF